MLAGICAQSVWLHCPWSTENHSTCVKLQASLRLVSCVALLEHTDEPSEDYFDKGKDIICFPPWIKDTGVISGLPCFPLWLFLFSSTMALGCLVSSLGTRFAKAVLFLGRNNRNHSKLFAKWGCSSHNIRRASSCQLQTLLTKWCNLSMA